MVTMETGHTLWPSRVHPLEHMDRIPCLFAICLVQCSVMRSEWQGRVIHMQCTHSYHFSMSKNEPVCIGQHSNDNQFTFRAYLPLMASPKLVGHPIMNNRSAYRPPSCLLNGSCNSVNTPKQAHCLNPPQNQPHHKFLQCFHHLLISNFNLQQM